MEESGPPKQGGSHGGINISGNAKVKVGRDVIAGDKIVQGNEYNVQGDMNVVNEAKELAEKLEDVDSALQALRAQVDESTFELAEYKLRDLQKELTRTDAPPNGAVITKSADSLMKNVPLIGGPLGAVFQTAAAQKVLLETGTVDWSRQKFGPDATSS